MAFWIFLALSLISMGLDKIEASHSPYAKNAETEKAYYDKMFKMLSDFTTEQIQLKGKLRSTKPHEGWDEEKCKIHERVEWLEEQIEYIQFIIFPNDINMQNQPYIRKLRQKIKDGTYKPSPEGQALLDKVDKEVDEEIQKQWWTLLWWLEKRWQRTKWWIWWHKDPYDTTPRKPRKPKHPATPNSPNNPIQQVAQSEQAKQSEKA